ncbi:MAG TPA: hypothetical protein ENJ53_08350, partial [Phaeodactylibacter sp.]|nr:hypothetical protein [Phaeodactylibacter sp.]
MLKRLFPITLLMLVATLGFSQNPQPIKIASPSNSPNQPESVLACVPGFGNEAGTISLGAFVGSSNDVDFDTMYLCFNDQILIDHDAGTESFAGDPDMTSPAGIGYAFYDCPPTVNGDLITIQSDPCVTDTPLPVGGAMALPYIATSPDNSGDVLFENLGFLQTLFGGGSPVLKWFAPITYDQLNGATAVFEGNPAGPCVDVNTDVAFAVVYLNEITATNIQSTFGGSNCQGSFDIAGGLPEFDAAESYNISITLNSDPSITGTVISGTATNGENVKFKITTPGLYDVVVTDGKACPANFQIDMTGCTALEMIIPDLTATPGSQICLPVTVSNFNN